MLSSTTYKQPFWAFNGHLETIVPALLRQSPPFNYSIEPLTLEDSDNIQLNWYSNNHRRLAVILPGLESNAERNYVKSLVLYLSKEGFDVLVPDHRGCGTKMNKLYRSYHSGNTEDLKAVLHSTKVAAYQEKYLLGFSLGGNIVLRYLGEEGSKSVFKKAATISAPFDLSLCSAALEKPSTRLYRKRFVRNLKIRLHQKATAFPNKLSRATIDNCQTIKDIDDVYTAPAHGFIDADDYYTQCSSERVLDNITTQTLIINAANDPIIPIKDQSKELLHKNKAISFIMTEKGGHVGHPTLLIRGKNWYERQVISFFTSNESET